MLVVDDSFDVLSKIFLLERFHMSSARSSATTTDNLWKQLAQSFLAAKG